MNTRINRAGAKTATTRDGAPTADEMIAAYKVPPHRQEAVRREFAAYVRRRDVSDGLLSSVPVSKSREAGRGLKDRLRRFAGAGGVAAMICGGRSLLVVDEAGIEGALAIGAMLMTAPTSPAMGGLDALGLRSLGQLVLDCCMGGGDADADRDDAHAYVDELRLLMRDGSADPDGLETLTAYESLCDVASIDPAAAAAMLVRIVEAARLHGPWIDVGSRADVVKSIWLQVEMDFTLQQLAHDPEVVATIARRRDDPRARRASTRKIVADTGLAPMLPGLL